MSASPKTSSVHHVVLFKLDKSKTDMAKIRQLTDNCIRVIPGLIELHFGEENPKIFDSKLDRANGTTHVLISRYINPEALKIYTTHPEHIKLVKYLRSVATAPPVAADFFSSSKL